MEENQLALIFDIADVKEIYDNSISQNLKKYISKACSRGLDIIGASIGCLCIVPIALLVFINNLKEKEFGPIFYVQKRIGKNGNLFKMYKFRTMVKDADQKLKELLENDENAKNEYDKYKKLKNDPRVTKFGDFLRKTSLDEFPQFLNVLKGDMTLVGPRPYLPNEKEDMGEYYDYIVEHKPGITGYWQINGRNDVTFQDRVDLDFKYHRKKSLSNDIKILLITVFVTIKKKGAM